MWKLSYEDSVLIEEAGGGDVVRSEGRAGEGCTSWDVVEWANERSINRDMRPEEANTSQFKVTAVPTVSQPSLQTAYTYESNGI